MRVFTFRSVSRNVKLFINVFNVCLSHLSTEKITFASAPSPQEFNEGDDADIVCNVVSSPPPTIIWKHKGSKIQVAKDGEPVQMQMSQCVSYFLTSNLPSHLIPPDSLSSHLTVPSCHHRQQPIHSFQSICHILPHLLLLLPIIFSGDVLDLIDDA